MQRFSDGARVVFIGDSITAANNFVARVFDYYRTELASAHVTFKNSGVSGGSTRSALEYLEPDVFPFEPTDAVIMLGVNDSNRTLLEQPDSAERRAGLDRAYDIYRVKLRELCDKLTERGIKLTLCTPRALRRISRDRTAASRRRSRADSALRRICARSRPRARLRAGRLPCADERALSRRAAVQCRPRTPERSRTRAHG